MKLLLSSLLLACLSGLSSWSVLSENKFVVTQSPDAAILEGETLDIHCCWDMDTKRVRVNWLKYLTGTKTSTEVKSVIINEGQCLGSIQMEKCDCSTLTLSNITRSDSGTYICKVFVEIPKFIQAQGNGTVITVTARNNTTNEPAEESNSESHHLVIIVSLVVVALLLLITLFCFWTLKRRQGSQRAARVIYEVPHSDSEGVEVDGTSTSSSRGSSQWCQVPVYESFDYFERVETKGSG